MKSKILNNKLLILCCAFLVAILSSCTQDISVSLPAYPSKLAVLCILEPDSIPLLYLNESKGSFDYSDTSNSRKFVEDAIVVIIGNGLKDTLKMVKETDPSGFPLAVYYKGKHTIQQGQTYSLLASHKGRNISAETYVPTRIEKDTFDVQKIESREGDEFTINLSISDPDQTEDFYLGKVNFTKGSPGPGPGSGPVPVEGVYNDFFWNNSSFADDKLTNGKQMKIPLYFSKYQDPEPLIVECYFYHTTKATSDYFRTLSKQNDIGSNPFVEPVMLTHNITGGLGIFGAATKSKSFLIELK